MYSSRYMCKVHIVCSFMGTEKKLMSVQEPTEQSDISETMNQPQIVTFSHFLPHLPKHVNRTQRVKMNLHFLRQSNLANGKK